MEKSDWKYYRITKRHRDYKGDRFFRVSRKSDNCINVLSKAGDPGRGRNNCPGIYVIGWLTFLSNYLAPGYVEQCSKVEYEEHFKKVVNLLS